MARSVDPYSNCLCGSGLKTKFCCFKIVDEMLDVYDALGQDRVALAKTILSKARSKTGGKGFPAAWVETIAALIVGMESSPENAIPLLDGVIARQSDFAMAYETRAEYLGLSQRLGESYDSLDAALLRTTAISPSLTRTISNLASRLEQSLEPLAALFLLTVAAATAKGSEREEFAQELLKVRGNTMVPIVVRSVPIRRFDPADAFRPLREKAFESSRKGAMRSAIAPLEQVANQSGTYDDWWQLATHLCCAARSKEAIAAFRRAAELAPDFELGVEAETYAQTLHRLAEGARAEVVSVRFECSSPAELSQALDRDPRVQRTPLPPTEMRQSNSISRWLLASGPIPLHDEGQPRAELPVYLGEVNLFPPGSGGVNGVGATTGYEVYLSANTSAGPTETVERLLTEIGGSSLQRRDVHREVGLPLEVTRLHAQSVYPLEIGPADRVARRRESRDYLIHEVWAKSPLDGLAGATPLGVQGQSESKRALAAAVLVLVDDLERMDSAVDEATLRAEFGLPPITPIPGHAGLHLHTLSVLAHRRLNLHELSDSQQSQLIDRLLPLKSPTASYRLMVEQARRDQGQVPVPADSYLQLASLANQIDRPGEALEWIEKIRACPSESRSFENRLNTDYLEMSIHGAARRLPETIEIAHRIWTEYIPKVPESRRMLCERLTGYAGDGPWSAALAAETARLQ
jgi:tetratricopeptide (TPR) repeat protein